MRIGIISGSVREPRLSQQVAQWVLEHAQGRSEAEFEVIDLRSFNVPLLTSGTHPMRANRNYDSEEVTAWGKAIDACDAFIFVTPEYNHGVPGGLKNAVDVLGPEWQNKTVAFVGYGSVGGVRSIEQWRAIMLNFSTASIRTEVNLNLFTDFTDGKLTPAEQNDDQVVALIDDLLAALS